jgi:hypothetical protein
VITRFKENQKNKMAELANKLRFTMAPFLGTVAQISATGDIIFSFVNIWIEIFDRERWHSIVSIVG